MNAIHKSGRLYRLMMLLAILFGMCYVLTAYLDFVKKIIIYDAVTLTNIATAVFRLECVILPLVFALPRNPYFPKIVLLKFFLALFCLTCLAGVMWFFQYSNYYSFREMFNTEHMYNYQGIKQYYISINRFLWANHGVAGVVLSFVLSMMYLVSGVCMHKGRITVASIFTVIALFRTVAPIVVACATGDWKLYYDAWIVKNTFWLVSELFFVAGIWIAAKSDDIWLDCVWGEYDAPTEEEDY